MVPESMKLLANTRKRKLNRYAHRQEEDTRQSAEIATLEARPLGAWTEEDPPLPKTTKTIKVFESWNANTSKDGSLQYRNAAIVVDAQGQQIVITRWWGTRAVSKASFLVCVKRSGL